MSFTFFFLSCVPSHFPYFCFAPKQRHAREAEQDERLRLLAWFQGETLGQLAALEGEVQDWALGSEGPPVPQQADAEAAVGSAEQLVMQERQRWQVVVGELAGRLAIAEEEGLAAGMLATAGGVRVGEASAAAAGAAMRVAEERDQLLGELRQMQLDVGDLGEQLEEEQQRAADLEAALDAARAALEERAASEAAAQAAGAVAEGEVAARLAILREEQAGAAALLWEMAAGLQSSALVTQQEAGVTAEAVAEQLEAQGQRLVALEDALADARADTEALQGQCAEAERAEALLRVEAAELAMRMTQQEHASA